MNRQLCRLVVGAPGGCRAPGAFWRLVSNQSGGGVDSGTVGEAAKLYVGNLSWSTTKDDLYDLFGRFGNVTDAFVSSDRETGRSRGFGFVTLDADGAASATSALDNTEFMGRNIRVNAAQPQGERGGGGRGGGRGYSGRGGGGYGGGGRGYGGGGGGGGYF